MKMLKSRLHCRQWIAFLVIVFVCFLSLSSVAEQSYSTKEKAIADIISQMNQAGITGKYNQAVWLHDWLTEHANYDYTMQEHEPEGVLLRGTGVCQSYTDAYALLLNELNIQNRTVSSDEMNHTWNLVLLDGTWCHVDVTWDDPGTGGEENHFYFGMSDAMIRRDHHGFQTDIVCETTNNYYPFKYSEGIRFSTVEELTAQLVTAVEQKSEDLLLYYTGTDSEFPIQETVDDWVAQWDWKYGLGEYETSTNALSGTVYIKYTDPWEKSSKRLENPVAAPDFSLTGLNGRYTLSNYRGNGVVLIFGRYNCYNTRAFLTGFQPEVATLNEQGVEVLVNVIDSSSQQDLLQMEEIASGYEYTVDDFSLLWNCLQAVGYDTSQGIVFPCVFMINSAGQIQFYSTGYVRNMKESISEAKRLCTGKALPAPEKLDYNSMANGTGNILTLSGGSTAQGIQAAVRKGNYVLFLTDSTIDMALNALNSWENDLAYYKKLGLQIVVSVEQGADEMEAQYPDVAFVPFDSHDFWPIRTNAGLTNGEGWYLFSSLYDPEGNCMAFREMGLLSLYECNGMIYEDLKASGIMRSDLYLPEGNVWHLPANITRIEEEAFAGTLITEVDIPAGVEYIADSAFAGCGLKAVYTHNNPVAVEFAENHGLLVLRDPE